MAYHSLVEVLESPFGKSPRQRLVAAVHGALRCDLSHGRLQAAGRALMPARLPEGAMERLIYEQIELDANPFMVCALRARSALSAVELHAELNRTANFALRTRVELGRDGALRIAQRSTSPKGDLSICRDTHVAAFSVVVARIGARSSGASASTSTISSLATKLGLEMSATRDAALAFEEEPGLSIGAAARLLGVNTRSFERWLRAEGLSPIAIKRASRLIRATALLSGEMTLTQIAHDCAFADLAHMSREFSASCALTPTQLRACVHKVGARAPHAELTRRLRSRAIH